MRQVLASLALVAAVSAAPLGTYCEWQCARDVSTMAMASEASASGSHCHEVAAPASASGPAVATGPTVAPDGGPCDGHDLGPALTEARRATGPHLNHSVIVAVADVAVNGRHAVVSREHSPPDVLPPPTSRPAILRI